jgi:hypothetical protein
VVPDWTYHPLHPVASAVLGERRTQVLALRLLSVLIRRAGGRRWIPVVFDHPELPPAWRGRFGATVSPWIARDAVTVLAVQGAGVVEINPVTDADSELVRRAADGRRCLVSAVTDDPSVRDAIASDVDAVSIGAGPDTVRLTTPDMEAAVAALADPATTVLATPAVLLEAGPGWFNRVIEAATPTSPPVPLRDIPIDPRCWPGWLWAALVGGLAVAGMVISTVGFTSVFVPTDLDFMGTHADHLRAADPNLLPFIAHDRAGFGGALVGAGLAILLISMWGWRRGQRWVWWCLLLGCTFGTVPVLIVHFAIGYTHVEHLAPVYVLVAVTATALALSRRYLTADDPKPVASEAVSAAPLGLVAGAREPSEDDNEFSRWWQETGEFELRQILHWRWDPIGVASAFPWAAEEYDAYAPRIAATLQERPSAERIAEQLLEVERDRMALSDSAAAAEVRRKVACAIVKWYEDSRARWWEFGPRPR